MGGLPPDALDVLVRTMARICENPYDRRFSMAMRDEDPQERMAELGDRLQEHESPPESEP